MSKYLHVFLTFMLVTGIAIGARAAPITVSSISAEWTNVDGGEGVTNTISGDGTAELRWGTDVGFGQSGYDFDPSAPPEIIINPNEAFTIGTFTHINRPILSGTSIESTQLDVLVEIESGGDTGPYLFSFLHDETPNRCRPRPSCASDIVTISNLVSSDTFSIGDQLFTLSILGFSIDGGETILASFSSLEGLSNSAQLYAQFVAVVPIPAALPLFLTMLFGMGALRWWRNRAIV